MSGPSKVTARASKPNAARVPSNAGLTPRTTLTARTMVKASTPSTNEARKAANTIGAAAANIAEVYA